MHHRFTAILTLVDVEKQIGKRMIIVLELFCVINSVDQLEQLQVVKLRGCGRSPIEQSTCYKAANLCLGFGCFVSTSYDFVPCPTSYIAK